MISNVKFAGAKTKKHQKLVFVAKPLGLGPSYGSVQWCVGSPWQSSSLRISWSNQSQTRSFHVPFNIFVNDRANDFISGIKSSGFTADDINVLGFCKFYHFSFIHNLQVLKVTYSHVQHSHFFKIQKPRASYKRVKRFGNKRPSNPLKGETITDHNGMSLF